MRGAQAGGGSSGGSRGSRSYSSPARPSPTPGDTQPADLSALFVPAASASALRLGRRSDGWPGRSCPRWPARKHALRSRHGRRHRDARDPSSRGRSLPALPHDAEPSGRVPAELWAGRRRHVAKSASTPAVSGPRGSGPAGGHRAQRPRARASRTSVRWIRASIPARSRRPPPTSSSRCRARGWRGAWRGVSSLLMPEMATTLQRDCDRLRAEGRVNRLENIAVRVGSRSPRRGRRAARTSSPCTSWRACSTTRPTRAAPGGGGQPDRAGEVRGVLDVRAAGRTASVFRLTAIQQA